MKITDPVKLSPEITVGLQPSESELKKLAKRGFKTVVNLSKGKEFEQEFTPEQEQEIVEELGLNYRHFPVNLSSVKFSDVDEFYEILSDVPRPVYIHCCFGQRSGPFALIAHAIRKNLSGAEAIAKSRKVGLTWSAPYITSFVESYIQKRAEAAAA